MKDKLTLIALNNALNSLEVEKERLTQSDKVEILDVVGVVLDKLAEVDARHREKIKKASKAVYDALEALVKE